MSRTLDLVCEECCETIWLGQGANCFYSDEKKAMEALGEFLFKHEKHTLVFRDNINENGMSPLDEANFLEKKEVKDWKKWDWNNKYGVNK